MISISLLFTVFFFYDNPNESETIKFNIQLIVFQAMAVMETTIIMADMEVSNK